MDVHVSLDGSEDLATAVYRQLREAVLDGRLRPGERLPPTRELAQRLAVSRTTVLTAYDRLVAEGFLVGRVGAGTFVSADALDRGAGRSRPRRTASGSAARPLPRWEGLVAEPTSAAAAPTYDFRVGIPDAGLFPYAAWRRLMADELRPSALGAATYGDPAGYRGLRTAIARHVGVARSVRASGDDVLVTSGAQQALDLVARVLVAPGTRVAVEEPGYPPARRLLASHGARIASVPVDDEGLDVDALPVGTRVVVVTPSHQYPLGIAMSLRRRRALLAWAERYDAVVVEDDYDSEFRFSDRPLEPLQSIDAAGRVVYVGSFSKTLLPQLRLGFLVAPPSLQPALHAAKQLTDWHGDLTTQAALARFLEEGRLARHVRAATRVYGRRREQVVEAVRTELAPWFALVPGAAGLHVCARLRPEAPRIDLDRVVRGAAQDGVALSTLGGSFAGRPSYDGLVIGYGAVADERVGEGLRRLVSCVRDAVELSPG